MQDSALGATLALTSFATNPLAAVPSTFFSVWHNISGSILSSWWRNHDDKHEIHWDSDNGEKALPRAPFQRPTRSTPIRPPRSLPEILKW